MSFLHLPETGGFVTSLDDVVVHSSGWYRLSPTVEITLLPLWDERHNLFARAGHGPIDTWLRAQGWRLPTVPEMILAHDVGLWIPPYTMPTLAMLTAANVPLTEASINQHRDRRMRSHRWCAIHDAEVFRALDAAMWDKRRPAPNAGKQWVAPVGTIFGWRRANRQFIQGPGRTHASEPNYGDYATTTFAVRDVAPSGPAKAPVTPPAAPPSAATPTALGQRGAAVQAWQRRLIAEGYDPGTPDGIHGPKTEDATMAWRREQAPAPIVTGCEPRIVTCAEWGARAVPVQATSPAKGIVIHHMALGSRPGQRGHMRTPLEPGAELIAAKLLARNLQASHQAQRWVDTGQHWSVTRGGVILEGRTGSLSAARRGLVVRGSHAGRAANTDHWGIEVEGDYTAGRYYGDVTPTVPPAQWDALVALVRWLLAVGRLSGEAIRGHREVPGNATGCPGTLLDRLPELRAAVA
jgi:peptidoglycan hydrolase-like protein with peptidoglycan-binding domain